MVKKRKSSGKVALAVLALTAVVFITMMSAAASAGHARTDAAQEAKTRVASPPQLATAGAGTVTDPGDGVRGEGSGTTDGDPDVLLDRVRRDVEVGIIRAIVVMATLGI